MTTRLVRLLIFCLFSTLRLSCTMQVAGGTETGHGHDEAVGVLYEPDGKTPAADAAVRMRTIVALADTSGAPPVDVASVMTDTNGRYAINGVDTGSYLIEATDGANNRVLIRPVSIVNKDSTKTLGPDTLMPAGAIKGKIVLSEGGDPRKVLVLFFGIDIFGRINADGSFLFKDLARGGYGLRFIPVLPDYDVLDSNGITVTPSDTIDLGVISLHYNGIPVPKGLAISYDSLKQIVTLVWDRPAVGGKIAGYAIYRKAKDSTNFAPIGNGVKDTIYHDSSGVQDVMYEYEVAAVDTNGNEGMKSTAVSVLITGTYGLSDSIATEFNPIEVDCDKMQNIYVTNGSIISKFDNSLKFLYDLPLSADSARISFAQTWGVVSDGGNNVYVSSEKGVSKFSSVGDYLFTFAGSDTFNQIREIALKDSIVYAASEHAVVLYDPSGKYLSEWATGPDFYPVSIAPVNQQVLVYCLPNQMLRFSDAGVIIESMPATNFLGLQNTGHLSMAGMEERNDTVFAVSRWAQKIFAFTPSGAILFSSSICSQLSYADIVSFGMGVNAKGQLFFSSYDSQRVYVLKKK